MPVLQAKMLSPTIMTTTVAILSKPILNSSFSRTSKFNPPKTILFLQFPASKSVFFGGFGCKRVVSKTMTELVKTSALMGSNGEESRGLLQQEAVVNGSNEFVAEGLETTLNRLVCVLSMEWLGLNEFTLILSAFALSAGSYFSWLRVSQQLHTINQVVVGAAVGSIFSILWYWSWNAIVLKAFISSLLVHIIVVLGAVAFCIGYLVYVICHWLSDG